MKKTLILSAFLCLTAGIATSVMYTGENMSQRERLMAANIEALAENEGLPVDVLLRNCHWAERQQCDVVYGGYIWGCSNMAKN